ncbi:hypothetical protein [uncultured Pontibacter sp.]|uniref:hypothetical protein n=1 Tax=uncultured Pontibacter sp. TaxID=453356 RepID=UPI002617CC78|nr:hypothetical protein [uncultured Pontibacter sp.]
MKFNSTKAQSNAIVVGAGAAGIVAANKIGKILQEKAPEAVKKHVPLILTAAGILVPAVMDIKNEAAVAALHGMSIGGVIQVANGYSVDETGALATSGIKGFLAKTVPMLSGLGSVELPPYEYYENTANQLMLAGSYQEEQPQRVNPASMFQD